MADYTIESFMIIYWQERLENCVEVRNSSAISHQGFYSVVVARYLSSILVAPRFAQNRQGAHRYEPFRHEDCGGACGLWAV